MVVDLGKWTDRAGQFVEARNQPSTKMLGLRRTHVRLCGRSDHWPRVTLRVTRPKYLGLLRMIPDRTNSLQDIDRQTPASIDL